MRVAIVGCGFGADFYARTLPNHPGLEVLGVTDRVAERASRFAKQHGYSTYPGLDDVLSDPRVEIVLNLTNPSSHYDVSKRSLEAGKHVYSEKPFVTVYEQAEELVRLAEARGLVVASAPCGVLGEAAQTAWRALRRGAIGKVRLAYAELDDGLIHRMNYRNWASESGFPWNYKDEFEVGCALEHAGYYVSWLVAFFGPARSVTSFASCLVPDKGTDVPLEGGAPDFTAACIEFPSGVAARITCSYVAPRDHRLRIFGDDGVLGVEECWRFEAPVSLKRRTRLSLWAEKFAILSSLPGIAARGVPLARGPRWPHRYRGRHQMDFARGVAELADAVRERRPCRLSPRFTLHVNEIVLAIQSPQAMGSPRVLRSTCGPMEPMPWARG